MPNRGIDGDIRRAKELRDQAKGIQDANAKQAVLDAAARYEKRAGHKARKLGKPAPKNSSQPVRGR